MDALPGAVLLPVPEVVVDQRPGRQVVGQVTPGAAVPGQVKQSIDDLAPLVLGRASALLSGGDQRLKFVPLVIGQVGRVSAAGAG